MKNYLYLVIVSFLLASCGSGPSSEGIIKYEVTYPRVDKGNFMLKMMPSSMTMTFKDNKYATSLSSVMGVVKTRFICDKDDESFSQLVKMFKKKYALVLKGEAIEESLNSMPSYSVAFNDETKEILGYLCNKATITINNPSADSADVFTVFYTNKIELETPNWCNQFKEIDGVMLEYQYEKYDVWMKFVAQSIKFKKVSDDEFIIDEDYQIITEEEMTEEMEKLFSGVVN